MAPSVSSVGGSKTSELDIRVLFLPKETLRGTRLVLKPPTPADDEPLRMIYSDLITMKYLPQFHRPNGWTLEDVNARRTQQEDEFLQGKRLTFHIHLLEKKTSGDEKSIVAGATGYKLNGDGTAEFGIILHHPFWRKGFNTEAAYVCLKYGFETLGLTRVDWFTQEDNAPMRRWCESLGMEVYERLVLDMGDSVVYCLSQTQWQSRVRQLLEQKVSRTDFVLT